MYATLLWGRPKIVQPNVKAKKETVVKSRRDGSTTDSGEESDECGSSESSRPPAIVRKPSLLVPGRYHYGSFYLRMGAVGMKLNHLYLFCLEKK